MGVPVITIAGIGTGCGKTTVTAGVLAALSKRGLKVQPYKVGPDFIDPMFHTFISGRHSRNLDCWMLGDDTVSRVFTSNLKGSGIAVIEGVMGLYDGYCMHSDDGSTAYVSRLTGSPVVLVIRPEGMAYSTAALVNGFRDFHSGTNIRGIILNDVNSDYYEYLKAIIEKNTGINVLGYIPHDEGFSLGGRHLGLVPCMEVECLAEKLKLLAEQTEKTIDIGRLLKIASEAERQHSFNHKANMPNQDSYAPITDNGQKAVKIAVAMDKAFNFYYRDNLELLERLGAELMFFSPLDDCRLPGDINGMYLGGGFPEVFAEELAGNVQMKQRIKGLVGKGLPVYAECGGFMYMTEAIVNADGSRHEMVGAIPGFSRMSTALQRFGYAELKLTADCILGNRNWSIRCHEFHYSTAEIPGSVSTCYRVTSPGCNGNGISWKCGYRVGNLLGGYAHLHFLGNSSFAEKFVESCRNWAESGIRN